MSYGHQNFFGATLGYLTYQKNIFGHFVCFPADLWYFENRKIAKNGHFLPIFPWSDFKKSQKIEFFSNGSKIFSGTYLDVLLSQKNYFADFDCFPANLQIFEKNFFSSKSQKRAFFGIFFTLKCYIFRGKQTNNSKIVFFKCLVSKESLARSLKSIEAILRRRKNF